MATRTPGPWTWEQGDGTALGRFVAANGEHVCSFGDCEKYYPTEGQEPDDADIALIKAAPELLIELRRCVALIVGEVPASAIAAIAKATGA